MAADFWFNSAGTWRLAKNLWFNDAGTWRTVKSAWFNDAGTWRKVFSSFAVVAQAIASNDTGAASQAAFNPDGSVTTSDASNGAWGSPTTTGIGASYWIKVHFNSGATGNLSGMTLDTYYSLSATQRLTLAKPTIGTRSSNFTYSISTSAADAGIVGSNSLSLTSTA